jgi:hypothetical protein
MKIQDLAALRKLSKKITKEVKPATLLRGDIVYKLKHRFMGQEYGVILYCSQDGGSQYAIHFGDGGQTAWHDQKDLVLIERGT